MAVAEVRRCLLSVRTMWGRHTPETPINLTANLPNGMTLYEFCHTFVLAHHSKRMQRSQAAATVEAESDDEDL
tara:strand:+ start:1370 stop:1588 length:219 start_codon:yes stop_codon:yes gene_type:complete